MNALLVAFKSDGSRRDFRVKMPRCVIGRRPDCDLQIPSSSVSRQHCEIFTDAGALRVRDLGSSNGTFLNGTRIQEAGLAPGDRLAVGHVLFTVQINGAPAAIEPARLDEGPTASDPRSGTSGSFAGIRTPEDSGEAPAPPTQAVRRAPSTAAAQPAPGAPDQPAGDADPLSRMISKSKSADDDSAFDFTFDRDDDDDMR